MGFTKVTNIYIPRNKSLLVKQFSLHLKEHQHSAPAAHQMVFSHDQRQRGLNIQKRQKSKEVSIDETVIELY